mgnify:CR=1 FL=1
MKSHSITSGLNEKQLTAVTYDAGSILVVAGAGSGKTKVLTTRIAWLIESKNIKPEEILAVTFTNKAAKEMNDRVAHLLEMNTKHMWIGTFHSVALRMLNKNLFEAGLSSKFQILDNNEQIGVIKRMLKNHNFDEKLYPPKDVQRFINNHKEQGIRAKNLTPDTIRAQHMTDLYVSYETFCHKESLLDFTELLLRAYELLQNYPAILEKYRKQFKNILIDEFQDTNNIQYKWLYLLAYKNIDLFAVGDDDQSIYSFRGALVSNMRLLLKDFNIKEPICLEQNYRSTSVILKAANAVIHNNDDRIGKHLWTDKKAGEHIKFYEAYTEEEEANFVCDEIVNLKDEGVSLSDIAILYRSNAQSRNFEQAFYNRSIAYIVYGGLRFFDRQEIKIILAYLKLIVNNNDNDSFIKVVNYPPRGIGVKTIELIEEFATNNSMSLYEASFHMTGTKKSIQSLQQFIKMIDDIKNDIKQLSLSNLINYVIEKIKLREYYLEDTKTGQDRIDNLNELINAVENYREKYQSLYEEYSDGFMILSNFLTEVALDSADTNTDMNSAVQLMTVHAAKGLEFKYVFLVGMEDGLFPHNNSIDDITKLQEERRLMYVAITRAKDMLYILRSCSRMIWGKRQECVLSRFLTEIPNDIINNISGISAIGYNNLLNNTNEKIANFVDDNSCNLDLIKHIDMHHRNTINSQNKISRVQIINSDDVKTVFKIGDLVTHLKFGRGKILSLHVDSKKTTAEIFFIGLGKKRLDLNIAKIEKCK